MPFTARIGVSGVETSAPVTDFLLAEGNTSSIEVNALPSELRSVIHIKTDFQSLPDGQGRLENAHSVQVHINLAATKGHAWHCICDCPQFVIVGHEHDR